MSVEIHILIVIYRMIIVLVRGYVPPATRRGIERSTGTGYIFLSVDTASNGTDGCTDAVGWSVSRVYVSHGEAERFYGETWRTEDAQRSERRHGRTSASGAHQAAFAPRPLHIAIVVAFSWRFLQSCLCYSYR